MNLILIKERENTFFFLIYLSFFAHTHTFSYVIVIFCTRTTFPLYACVVLYTCLCHLSFIWFSAIYITTHVYTIQTFLDFHFGFAPFIEVSDNKYPSNVAQFVRYSIIYHMIDRKLIFDHVPSLIDENIFYKKIKKENNFRS